MKLAKFTMKITNKKSVKKSKPFNDADFEKLIQKHTQDFFKKFNSDYEKHEVPFGYARDEHGRIDGSISQLHDSNKKLNQAFFEVLEIKKKDKNRTYPDVIKDYSKKSNVNHKQLFEFMAHLSYIVHVVWIPFYYKTVPIDKLLGRNRLITFLRTTSLNAPSSPQ